VVMHRLVVFLWDTFNALELGQVENIHGWVWVQVDHLPLNPVVLYAYPLSTAVINSKTWDIEW
jgi:hypothetical protein